MAWPRRSRWITELGQRIGLAKAYSMRGLWLSLARSWSDSRLPTQKGVRWGEGKEGKEAEPGYSDQVGVLDGEASSGQDAPTFPRGHVDAQTRAQKGSERPPWREVSRGMV